MRTVRRPRLTGAPDQLSGLGLAVLALALLAGGCRSMPPSMPPTPGYVSTERRNLRHADFSASLLGAYPRDELAGRLQVEPYATRWLSFPIEAKGGYPGNLQLRVGPRLRTADWAAVGLGLGATFYRLDNDENAAGYGHVDLELVFGWRWDFFGLSLGLRPSVGGGGRFDGALRSGLLTGLGDLSLAFFLSRRSAITIHLGGYAFAWLTEPSHWYGSAFWGMGFTYNPR